MQTWQERGHPGAYLPPADQRCQWTRQPQRESICKLHRQVHRQRISIGLVPAFKQTILALCHELHVSNTYRVSSFSWVLGNLWVNMGHKSAHHPCGRARSKVLMCIEHVCCMKQSCQWITRPAKDVEKPPSVCNLM